ncbi:hypothetical protein CF319_g4345 [Tilletia indica]|nr:hypothetical protein CF319_g4345 [Tilletia indica]
MYPASSSPRNGKWPTHLSITTDVIFGTVESKDYSHKVDSTIFGEKEESIDAVTHIWARSEPKEGAYLVTHAPFAPNPMRMNINDADCIRQIPESMDGTYRNVYVCSSSRPLTDSSYSAGSNPDNETIPPALPFISGIGVIKDVETNKKKGTLAGFVFFNRLVGWIEWSAEVSFEDSIRWLAWTLPPPRTLVSFDAVLTKVRADGTMELSLRRINNIDAAPQNLLTGLHIGQAAGAERAARIRLVRAKAVANVKKDTDISDVFTEDSEATPAKDHSSLAGSDAPTAPVKTTRSVSALGPPSSPVKITRSVSALGPPSSPSPAPITSKATRNDHNAAPFSKRVKLSA